MDELNEIRELLKNTEVNISGLIQGNMDYETDFAGFCKLVKFVELLGEIEHTSDWDLYIEFEMKSGDLIETISGYSEIELIGDNLVVEGPVNTDEEITEDIYLSLNSECASVYFNDGKWTIPIKDVASVSLQR